MFNANNFLKIVDINKNQKYEEPWYLFLSVLMHLFQLIKISTTKNWLENLWICLLLIIFMSYLQMRSSRLGFLIFPEYSYYFEHYFHSLSYLFSDLRPFHLATHDLSDLWNWESDVNAYTQNRKIWEIYMKIFMVEFTRY